jgi:hypothetical protein
VTTEDGQIYECYAILQHFKIYGHVSPVTRNTIDDKLIPQVTIKSHIESSIRDGLITDELADHWKLKEREWNEFKELVRKAEGGDSDAMTSVGRIYIVGENGVTKDGKTAFQWFKRASDAGNAKGMAFAGMSLLSHIEGINMEKNVASGIMLVTMAAERGSDSACLYLGRMLANGILMVSLKRPFHRHLLFF